MNDDLNDTIRNLEELINIHIKQEPIDDDDNTNIVQRNINNSRHESNSNYNRNDPRLSQRNSSGNVYEGIRKNFLEKNLNVQDVLCRAKNLNKSHHQLRDQVNAVYARAKAVKNQADECNTTSFYAHIPPKVDEFSHLQQRHASPVAQNLHSSIFSFQATSETASGVSKNPYSEISFSTQNIGRIIGISMDEMIIEKNKSNAMKSQTIANRGHESAQQSQRTPQPSSSFSLPSSTISKENKNVQTGDTGSFILEIPCEEMVKLTERQKDLLLQVIKEFKIKISKNSEDLLERIKHRQAELRGFDYSRKPSMNKYSGAPPM